MLLATTLATSAYAAGTIRSPVAATANVAPASPGDLQNTINQSCLSAGFVSGSTDFDTYLSGNPSHSVLYAGCEWFSTTGVTAAVLTFDMGQVLKIDRLALWNEESSGISAFTVAYSADGVTYTAVPGVFNPTNWPVPTNNTGSYTADVFALGTMSARFVRLNIACPQHPSAYFGCSLGEIAFSTAVPAKVEITLTAPPADNKYLITNVPKMPEIKAKAKVVGVLPDPTATTTFTWAAELKATKGSGPKVSYAEYLSQDLTTTGEQGYSLTLKNPSSFLGGDLQLTAKAVVNDVEILGTTPASLAIHGTNPARTEIQGRVDTAVDARSFTGLGRTDVKDALKRMACQESTQKQFNGARDGGTGSVLVSFDDGVGIFQITGGDPLKNKPAVAFDWRANVDEGATVFGTKVKVSKGYPASLRTNAQYKRVVSETVNQNRCMGNLQPIGLPAVPRDPPETYSERCLASPVAIPGDAPAVEFPAAGLLGASTVNLLLEDGVRGYNGYGAVKLYGVALREFRPDIEFLTATPDSSLPTLAANTALWQRVPESARGTAGDPQYVSKVTAKQTSCP